MGKSVPHTIPRHFAKSHNAKDHHDPPAREMRRERDQKRSERRNVPAKDRDDIYRPENVRRVMARQKTYARSKTIHDLYILTNELRDKSYEI